MRGSISVDHTHPDPAAALLLDQVDGSAPRDTDLHVSNCGFVDWDPGAGFILPPCTPGLCHHSDVHLT